MLMFQDASSDPSIEIIDFGLGDAQYKRRFGNDSWRERAVTLVAPRARPLAVAAAQRLCESAARAAAAALDATGRTDSVKRRWRRRLRADAR
jgi:CelD/BcsL family acetyltransferase involved in cellulose biosynthesis